MRKKMDSFYSRSKRILKKLWTRRVREATASFFCVVTTEVFCGPCSVVPHLPLFPFTSFRVRAKVSEETIITAAQLWYSGEHYTSTLAAPNISGILVPWYISEHYTSTLAATKYLPYSKFHKISCRPGRNGHHRANWPRQRKLGLYCLCLCPSRTVRNGQRVPHRGTSQGST